MVSGVASAAEMVRAAYDLTLDQSDWLARCIERFRPYFEDGFGAYGGLVCRFQASIVWHHLAEAHPVNRQIMSLGLSAGFLHKLPESFATVSCAAVVGPVVSHELITPFYDLLPADDHHGISISDGVGFSIFIAAPRRRRQPPSQVMSRLGRRVLPHIASALRLRRALTGHALDTDSAEAIFSPVGKCLHASGFARSLSARALLREAVQRLEQGRCHTEEGASADQDFRESLLSGRWSLVERFDSDGRRFIVAYRNPTGIVDPRRLSAKERDVASLLATGVSQKAISIELGLRASTVARVASSVTSKLGLASTREIPIFWKDASGRAMPLGVKGLVALSRAEQFPNVPQLTGAEQQVLDELMQGRSNHEIALSRGTSVRTVANQVASLFRKLDVDSRYELMAHRFE